MLLLRLLRLGSPALLVLFLLRQGDGDDPVALLLELHDLDALGAAAAGADVADGGADQHALLGDHQQVLSAVHHLDGHHLAGLGGHVVVPHALAAPARQPVLLHRGLLAVAVLGDGEDVPPRGGPGGAHHVVAVLQPDAPDAHGLPAHGPHVVLVEADGLAVPGGNEDLLRAVGLPHRDQLIPLLQGQGPDAAGADVPQGRHRQALDGALPGDHHQVPAQLRLHVPGVDHGAHRLPGLHRQDVDDVGAPGGLSGGGDLVALLPVGPAGVGEEQDVVVCGGGEHGAHAVLLLGGHGLVALAAPTLLAVLAGGGPLDVAAVGEGIDALLLLDQVLHVQLVLHEADLRHPVVAVLVGDGLELLLQHLLEEALVAEEPVEVGDPLLQLLVLRLQLLPVQPLQGLQPHVQDGLGLDVVQADIVL